VSFLPKQQSRIHASPLAGEAGLAGGQPKTRRGERPPYHSRASGNPGFFAPAPVSFLRKQESRKKILDSRVSGNDIQGAPGFPRKRE